MRTPFIIMLDLDGPVCTGRAKNGIGDYFDPVAAGLIANLCRDSGAKIVIISARRRDDGLIAKLTSLGIGDHLFPDDVHWRTGHDPQGIRGNEVDSWHKDNPGHAYAIVDDERGGYAPHHIQRLVHTDMHAGLSVKDVLKIKRLMGVDVSDRDIDHSGSQTPRISIAQLARDAAAAMDQGDTDSAARLLDIISDHPLAQ